MNPAHLWIIACICLGGMWALTGSPWKAICYTVWIIGALAFWGSFAVVLYSCGS